MAMSSWITLASSAAWGSGPSITAKFEYCYERSGADMRYQVRITINTLPYSTSYFGYPIYTTIKLDSVSKVSGYTIKSASPSQWSSAIVYTTGVMTVSNKTSGSTSLSINLYSGSGESRDITYNYTLTVAPAASTIDSVSNIETGSPVSVKWTPRNSAFKYNLTFKIGSTTIKSVTGVSPGSTSQYNYTGYTPAHSELPSSTSATVSVTLDTYSGSTKIGSDTKNFTLSVPASVAPSIGSLSVSAVNDIAAFGSRFVAGKSAAQWSCSASPGSGSSIKSYVFSFAGVSGGTASGTTDVIPGDGSFTPSITVTDNRGRSATYTGSAITVYPYANPVVTTALAERCNGSGTADESGTRIAVLLSATCSSVGGSNSVTIRARKRATGGNWGAYTTLTQGERQVLSGTISTTSSYQVELSAIDTVGNETIILVSIPTAGVTFHLRKGGKGAAFGKYSEKEAFECAWPAEFSGAIKAAGNIGGNYIQGTWLQSTAHTDLGGAPTSYPVFDGSGWVYHRTKDEMLSDLGYGDFADNIIFESGEQTDERFVRFKNTTGENTHNCSLYGGNPNSTTGIGLWDTKHGRRILAYLDNANDLKLGNDSCYITSERRLRTLAVSSGAYMNASQTITLSDKVSNQLTGIIIAWSYYNGSSQDYDWNYTFIPKEHVLRHSGAGIDCKLGLTGTSSNLLTTKYIYVTDTTISGHAFNSSDANSAKFVLRYVYGV